MCSATSKGCVPFLVPRFHSVLRARLTIESPFCLFVFFPLFVFKNLQSASVASSAHGHASLLQARASERSNRLGKLSSNTPQNTTNEKTRAITTNPLPLAPKTRSSIHCSREKINETYSDVLLIYHRPALAGPYRYFLNLHLTHIRSYSTIYNHQYRYLCRSLVVTRAVLCATALPCSTPPSHCILYIKG